MRRIIFYFLEILSFISKIFGHKLYMNLIVKAHKICGCNIIGMPAHIDLSAHIDASGGLTICNGVGISVKAIILTHDWSFLRRYRARNITPPVKDRVAFDKQAYRPVYIGDYSLMGAGAIVLPGSKIGKFCLIGAGAVVKGEIEDYSIVIGNPAKKIGDTRDPKYKLLE